MALAQFGACVDWSSRWGCLVTVKVSVGNIDEFKFGEK